MANITIIIDGKTYEPLNQNEITIEQENDGTATIRHRISRLCIKETESNPKPTREMIARVISLYDNGFNEFTQPFQNDCIDTILNYWNVLI